MPGLNGKKAHPDGLSKPPAGWLGWPGTKTEAVTLVPTEPRITSLKENSTLDVVSEVDPLAQPKSIQ